MWFSEPEATRLGRIDRALIAGAVAYGPSTL